jgi:hypothetical protein
MMECLPESGVIVIDEFLEAKEPPFPSQYQSDISGLLQ